MHSNAIMDLKVMELYLQWYQEPLANNRYVDKAVYVDLDELL